jgi:PAS domain S-box-containing protein
MPRPPRPSLRATLLVGVVGLLLPVFALLVWELRDSHERRREAALDLRVRTAVVVGAIVDRFFDGAIEDARAIASDPIVRSLDLARLDDRLAQLATVHPHYLVLSVFDASGENVGSSLPYAAGEPRTRLDPGVVPRMATGAGLEVRPVFQGTRQGGKPLVSVRVPVLDDNGALTGVVSLIVDPGRLSAQLGKIPLGPREAITVIDPRGRIAFDSRRLDLSWEERDVASLAIVRAALAGETVHRDDVPLGGEDHVVGLVPSQVHGWPVLVAAPATEVFTPIRAALRRDLLAFGLIAALALGGAWALAGHVHALARQLAAARDRAEAEHARFRTMFDSVSHGMLFVDAEGGATANPVAVRLFGGPLVGEGGTPRWVEHVLGPDGRRLDADRLPARRALRGEAVAEVECVIERPDGRRVPVLSSAAPVRSAEGRLLGAIVVFQDITAMKELERLKQEWVSIVAHDLRQPLSTMAGYAGLIRGLVEQPGGVQAEKIAERLADIERAAQHQNRMIDDLLDASRLAANRLRLERRPVDLGQLAHDVAGHLAPLLDGRVVHVEAEPGLPLVPCDPGRIEQVLSNLLSNAAKYGRPGTDVRVDVRRRDGEVEVSIVNRGDGIAAEDLPHLFTRFQRAPSSARDGIPGIGLGLYISRGLVEAHGGRIRAESAPGEATAFRFTLPLSAPA